MSSDRSATGGGWRGRLRATAHVLTTPEMLIVATVAFMHGLMQTMYKPLVAPYAASLGAGPFLAGTAVAVQALPGLLLAVPVGSAAGRLGTQRMLVLAGTAVATGGVLVAVVASLPALLVALLLTGCGALGIALAAQDLATEPVKAGDVDTRRIAGFGTFILVGHLIGPTVGGVLADLWGYRSAFWALAAIGLAFVPVTVLLGRSRTRRSGADGGPEPGAVAMHGSYRRAFRLLGAPLVPAALTLSGFGILLQHLRTSLLPLYLDRIGWSAAVIGVLLSATALAALLSRVMFPLVERRVTPRTLLRASLIGGAGCLALAVATSAPPVVVGATAISGVLLGSVGPSSLTLLSRLVSGEQRTLVLGVRITVSRMFQSAGPVVFGMIAAAAGLRPAFFTIAAGAGAAGGLATRGLERRRRGA